MRVRERILAIRIAEAISKHPEMAEELGISAELVECRAALKEPHERKTMGNYKDMNFETLSHDVLAAYGAMLHGTWSYSCKY